MCRQKGNSSGMGIVTAIPNGEVIASICQGLIFNYLLMIWMLIQKQFKILILFYIK